MGFIRASVRALAKGFLSFSLLIMLVSSGSARAGNGVSYQYDKQGRLTQVSYAEGSRTVTYAYTYDAAGNRRTVSVSGLDQPQVKIFNDRALENNPTGSIWPTVYLTSPATKDVTVQWVAVDGSATYGADYLKNAGTAVIHQGTQTATIEIPLQDDTIKEGDETFTVKLVSANGAEIVAGDKDSAIATIRDDDVAHFNVADVTAAAEGDYVALTIDKVGGASQTIDVTLGVSGVDAVNSATEVVDYETTLYSAPDVPLTSTTLTFAPAETQKTVYVKTVADTVYEPDEYFYLALNWTSQDGCQTTDGSCHSSEKGQVTIPNDDPQPTVKIGNTANREGNGLNFTLWMTNQSYQPVTVTMTVADTSATNTEGYASATFGVDYDVSQATVSDTGAFTISGNTLTYVFQPGVGSVQLTIPSLQDSLVEGYEAFYVNIANVDQGLIDSTQFEGRGRINDDDTGLTASISSPAPVLEGNSGAGNTISFPVTLSANAFDSTTINWSVTGGSATAGTDYTGATSGTLTIPMDSNSGVIQFTTKPDTTYEPNETLQVTLSSATNASISGSNVATATISNDDNAPPVITAGSATLSEAENTLTTTVLSTYNATDPEGGTLTYSLTGTDAGDFTINSSGQLKFKARPDYEAPADSNADNVYNVTVKVTDPAGLSDTQAVAVTVTNVNELPVFTAGATTITNAENTAASTVLSTYSASDPEGSALTYTLGGDDANVFTITSGGQLQFKVSPNYEAPTDSNGDNVYNVIVTVSDSSSLSSAKVVTVTVTNVNEAPTATSDDEGQVDIWNSVDQIHGKIVTFDAHLANSTGVADNDSDPDAGDKAALKFHSVSVSAGYPSAGTTISTDGSQVDINLRKCGYYQFDYTVEDPGGLVSNVATMKVQAISTSTSVACPIVVPSGTTTPTASLATNATVAEGTATANTLQVPVTLSSAAIADTTVTWQIVSGGSAVAGTDFVAPSTNYVNIASGQTTGYIQIQTIPDAVTEADKTIQLQLVSGTNADINTGIVTSTITNDDGGPSFSINNVSATEGGTLTFTITKTGATALSHSVSYATANGTAGSSDYTGKSGTLTFAPGDTSKTVSVATTQDSIYETNETVKLNLSGATGGATISGSQGIGTINNDDSGPSFKVSNSSVTEGGNLTFTITKVGSTAKSHSISYATANGTAGSGDYTSKSGTLTFAPGDTSKAVSVATTGDTVYENNETVKLNLSSATNGATISDSQGIGTIVNNDAAPTVNIWLSGGASKAEGNSFTFIVAKSGSTALTHKVTFSTANGTATAGSDYTGKSVTLTFPASGADYQTQSVVVSSIDDTKCGEGNETFNGKLSGATNGMTYVNTSKTVTITENDNCPPHAVNDSYTALVQQTNTFNVLNNDYDTDGGTLTITAASKVSGVIGNVSHTGSSVSYTPLQCGSATLKYTISDGQGGSATANVAVTVSGSGCTGGSLN
nr:Calx-beta domain-containing protein [Kordiimonas marina]